MSAHSVQRPDSRASTTSATSHHDDDPSQYDAKASQSTFMNTGPEAALLQYQQSMPPQQGSQYDMSQLQHMGHHHAQSAPYPIQGGYPGHDSAYLPQEVGYSNHVRVGSVPIQSGSDLHDDKRRKGSAVTATNDKELREMLAKNEGRPLRDVAQEVIQKERTPMAEKTKQLFAMLW
jgi:regulatory factor X